MSVAQIIKRILFSDEFDPFDLTQLEPPKTFRTRNYSQNPPQPIDPFEGFRESMEQLGAGLKRGLEIDGSKKQ